MEKSLAVPKPRITSDTLLRSDAARRVLAFAALVLLILYFSFKDPNFTRSTNIIGIFTSTFVNGVLALGVTFVIITGGIDLSIGTVMTLSAVLTAILVTNEGLPIPVGVAGGIATGLIAGLVNGVIISWMRVPPFITTLGMMYVAKGLALVLAELRPIYFSRESYFNDIAMGNTLGVHIGDADVPNAVWILLISGLIGAFLLNKTILGRYTFALGSNEEATRLSGVKTKVWKTAVYTVCGIYAGLGGVLMASRLNSAQPALGQGYELDAIAAVVIGGTVMSGGEGTILGTLIGAFVISVLQNGLRIMGVSQEWQYVVTGTILVIVVFIDIMRRQR